MHWQYMHELTLKADGKVMVWNMVFWYDLGSLDHVEQVPSIMQMAYSDEDGSIQPANAPCHIARIE